MEGKGRSQDTTGNDHDSDACVEHARKNWDELAGLFLIQMTENAAVC